MILSAKEVKHSANALPECFAYHPHKGSLITVNSKFGEKTDEVFTDIYYLEEQDSENGLVFDRYRLPREPITKQIPEHQYMKEGPLKISLPKILTSDQFVYFASKVGTIFVVDWNSQSSLSISQN